MRVVSAWFEDWVDRGPHVLDKEFRLRQEVVLDLVDRAVPGVGGLFRDVAVTQLRPCDGIAARSRRTI